MTDFFGLNSFFDELIEDVDARILELTRWRGDVEQEVGYKTQGIDAYMPTIHRLSSLTAIDILRNNAVQRFVLVVEKALEASVEFDIPLFREPLIDAIINSSIGSGGPVEYLLIPSESGPGVTVEINMDGLGPPEVWAEAVKRAREVLGIGKMPEPIASVVWKEKIYGVDREGKQIIHPRTEEDITERYTGKYYRTIETRMGFIPSGMAPWWYILEHGSRAVNLDTKDDIGEPYPVVPATRFVSQFEQELAATYTQIYNRVHFELVDAFSRMIEVARERAYADFRRRERAREREAEELVEREGIRGITPKLQRLATEVGLGLSQIYIDAAIYRREIPINQTLTTIVDDAGDLWSVYRTANNMFGLRYNNRNPITGRFVSR